MATLDGIDQSWGRANAAKAKAAGIKVVSMYLSNDTTKNVSPADVKGYHKLDIGVILNWEANSGNALLGSAQAIIDATKAVKLTKSLIKNVGYAPENQVVIYFSCDRQVNSSQFGSISEYYKAAGKIVRAAGYLLGVYGEAALVHYLSANKITDAEWQTLAWSGGVLDPAADFYQTSINHTLAGASVDFDQIIHINQLGAWWSPSNPLNTSEDDVSEADVITALQSDAGQAAIQKAVWKMQGTVAAAAAHPPTSKDTVATMEGFVLGDWNYSRGTYFEVDATAIANAVVSKMPKNVAGLTSAQITSLVEAGVKAALAKETIKFAE